MLKQCDAPQLAASDIRAVVDSFQKRELVTDNRISVLSKAIEDRDTTIARLRDDRALTKVVYRQTVKTIRQLLPQPGGCDSLKEQVTALLDLSSHYEEQADSIITQYEGVILIKDSILILRNNQYADLRRTFESTHQAYNNLNQDWARLNRNKKRDRWVMGGLAAAAIMLAIKK